MENLTKPEIINKHIGPLGFKFSEATADDKEMVSKLYDAMDEWAEVRFNDLLAKKLIHKIKLAPVAKHFIHDVDKKVFKPGDANFQQWADMTTAMLWYNEYLMGTLPMITLPHVVSVNDVEQLGKAKKKLVKLGR